MSLPWVPMDILTNHILPRLPARSLLRYKSVLKAFHSLISSSQFIHLHLHLHLRFHPSPSTPNRLLLLIVGHDDLDQSRLYTLALDETTSEPVPDPELDLKPPHALPLPLPHPKTSPSSKTSMQFHKNKNYYDQSIYLVGSCNGLVCLGFPWTYQGRRGRTTWGDDFIFVNPLTRMFTSETSSPVRPPNTPSITTRFGFGYDAKNNDYKLVQLTTYIHKGGRKVNVYSMKANAWKQIDEPATTTNDNYWCYNCGCDCSTSTTSGALAHNNLIHWLFQYSGGALQHDDTMVTHRIVCFDLETEQWAAHAPLSHHLHYEMTNRQYHEATLGIFGDGSWLGMMLNIYGRDETDVWVMKEYGVEESWTKLCSIAPRLPLPLTGTGTKNENASIFSYWTRTRRGRKHVLLNLDWPQTQLRVKGCFWYDFEHKKIAHKLQINGLPSSSSFTALTMCVESLAPVFGGSRLSNNNASS